MGILHFAIKLQNLSYFNDFGVKSYNFSLNIWKILRNGSENFKMAAIFKDGHHLLYGNIAFCYKIAKTCPISMILVSNCTILALSWLFEKYWDI